MRGEFAGDRGKAVVLGGLEKLEVLVSPFQQVVPLVWGFSFGCAFLITEGDGEVEESGECKEAALSGEDRFARSL